MSANNERTAFSDRLREAMRRIGFPDSRPTELQRSFNLRYTGDPISVFAARKWLLGEAIPTQEKLVVLADWLNLSTEWLRFGTGGVKASTGVARAASRYSRHEAALLGDIARLSENHQNVVREFVSMLLRVERSATSILRANARSSSRSNGFQTADFPPVESEYMAQELLSTHLPDTVHRTVYVDARSEARPRVADAMDVSAEIFRIAVEERRPEVTRQDARPGIASDGAGA